MKKRYLTALSLIFIFIIGAFAGCTGTSSKFSFVPNVTEIEIILGETTTDIETIDNSVAFSVTKKEANADDGIWVSIENESIIAVKEIKSNVLQSDYVVTGLMPGTATIKLYNLANSKQYKEIQVNVFQQIQSVNFVSDEDIYIPFGGTYAVKADTELNVSPIHSAKSDLRYEIVENIEGVTVNEITGVIDATNAMQAGQFTLKVYGKNAPDNYDTKTVRIVKPIERETLSLKTNTGDDIIKNGEVVKSKIELVKTIEHLSYVNLTLECSDYASDLLDLSILENNLDIIQAELSGNNVIRVQAVSLGESSLKFAVNLKNANDYLEEVIYELSFKVIDIPNGININGQAVADVKEQIVYDRYNDGILGEAIRFTVSPSSVLVDDSEIQVTYEDIGAVNTIRFLDEKGNRIETTNGSFTITSGQVIYARADNASNDSYNFLVESVKAKEYDIDVKCTLEIKVITGISSITVPNTIYIEKGSTYDLNLFMQPSNANLNGFEVGEVSDSLSINKIGELTYTITANEVTDEILYIYYRNGGYTQTRIITYVPLTQFAVEVDSSYTNNNIGDKEYYNDGITLKKIYIQLNSVIDLKMLTNSGATIIDTNYVVANSSIISCADGKIKALREGVSQLVITVAGYQKDGDGAETEYTATITVETYRAISSISLNRLSAVAYDYTSVGFYNKSLLSQINLIANVYPQNATYANEIEWQITDRTSNDSLSGSLSATSGVSTTFTAGPLEGDMDTVVITATVKEFNKTYTENCVIQVNKAKLVNSIVLSNVVNGNIYFDSREGLDNVNNTFKVEAIAYPTDALNTKVRYQYVNIEENEAVDNAVFKVDNNGVVTPLRAGKAKLRISSEDSFENATDATTYVEVFVTVQDGKTKETAFHISTTSDLLSIGTDRMTMSYYYILTNDIDLSNITNFEPIGYAKNLSFTGYLSGLFTFEQVIDNKTQIFSLRSSIVNMNLNKSIISNDIGDADASFYGLFSQISSGLYIFGNKPYDTIPRVGTVTDLTIQINSLNIDCSGINVLDKDYKVYVGGLAGRYIVDNLYKDERENAENLGKVGIINTSVIINEFKYSVGKNYGYIGGLLGQSNADILYNTKTNAVSGNDIIIIDKIKYQIPGVSAEDTYHPTYYVGGLVGQNDGYIQSVYNEKNGDEIIFSSLFEDEGIDVIVNINNQYNGINYANTILSENAVIGGLVGQNNGFISNTSTDNIIYGLNNVGGLVGINGTDGKILNSFSSSLVRGANNVGGLVGMSSGIIENCYTQSYEDNVSLGDNAINVKGESNVGGVIGYAVGGTISKIYSVTYKDRVIGTGNNASEYAGDVVGTSNVGGLIGNALGATGKNLVVEFTYTNFVAMQSGMLTGLIGNAKFVDVTNSYIESKSVASIIALGDNYNVTNSYIKYGNSLIIFDATGNSVSNFNSFSNEYWNKSTSYPYLEFDGVALVQQAPTNIEITIVKNKVNDNSALLFYYTSSDMTDKLALVHYNIYKIGDIISANVLPKSGYVNRLKVTSENEEVVRVLSDGSLNVVGVGSSIIRVTSKLSAKVYAEFNIYTTYPVLSFEMYASNNVLAGAEVLDVLRIKKGENKQIRPYITATVSETGTNTSGQLVVRNIDASIASEIYIEYVVECADPNGYKTYFTFENATDIDSATVVKDYYLSHIINAVDSTNGSLLTVTARPYLVLENDEKVYLDEYFDSENFVKNFQIGVSLGATDFKFITEENTTISAGTEVVIKSKLFTDDADDEVLVTILNSQNKLVSSYTGGNLSSSIFNLSANLSSLDADAQSMDYSLTISLNDANKFIKEETTYSVILSAKTNPSVKLTYFLTFVPENIQRVETRVYTYAEKDVMNNNAYNPMEEPSNSIIPGYNALLSLNIFPSFADFDYIEITNEDVSFEQLVKNDTKTGYPYETLDDRNYLVNGITLVNAYYKNGQLMRGVNGEYYVSMLVASDIKEKNLTISINAYKDVNGKKTLVYGYDLPLECAYLPEVELSYNGETSKNNNEVYVPYGTESELSVAFFDYSGDVEFDITKDGVGYPYLTVENQNGKYVIKVSSLASVGDVIEIKATISKKIGKVTMEATDTLEIIIVDYVIQDIGFENVYNNVLNEVFGGTYILKLSFENSKFFYDTTNESVKAKIIADLDKLSTSNYNTWYAYKASSTNNDVAIGKYYKNAYYEVNSKSVTSKDLYVSGVQYDNKDSNQKRISAKLKFSFDRVTKEWVYEKSGIENIYRSDDNLNVLLTDKYIANGKVYQVLDRVFTVDLYLNTSRENAVPIYNEEEFYAMESDISYILMTDLVLENFTPISTNVRSFNGNNHTITIKSYLDETPLEERSGTKNIGLFTEIYEGAIFENIKIVIGNETLNIDATGYSEVVFGLLASVNNGNIYNCSVSYNGNAVSVAQVNRVINGVDYVYPYDYAILLSDNGTVSGNLIPATSQGLKVQITLTTVNDDFVESTMGILVGENEGYITNSRVESGVKFHSYGVVGAIAGINGGVISSSYSKATIYSYTSASEYSQIGGFVGENSGRIHLSFVEGVYNFNNRDSVPIEINAINRIGGFVYSNSGTISDCYSNVRINSNAPTAGFVFTNSGTIKNTYSTSIIRENSMQDMPFIGLNEYNQVNNSGTISKAYFLKGNYTNQEEQPATMINNVSDFALIDTFDSFAFDTDVNGNINVNSTNGVWFIPTNNASQVSAYKGQQFIVGKPTIVSANIISRGYVDLLTVTNQGGQPEYVYTSLIGANYGSIEHPYVIYSASEFNSYVLEPAKANGNNKYYILASDIDFSDEVIMADSYRINFNGYFEGNAMEINSLRMSYLNSGSDDDYSNMGLFRTIDSAVFKNVSLNVEEMFGSTIQSVGAIAGTIKDSKVYNINLYGDAIVHGKNMVGGLAGKAENSVIKDIYSEISVNAGYRATNTYLYEIANADKVSYAGGVIGAVINSQIQSVTVTNGSTTIGEMAGGAFGFIDKTSTVSSIGVVVTNEMFVKGMSMIGGIASENRGTINKSFIQYEDDVQSVIDTGESVGYFNAIANNSYYRVGITDSNRIENKATSIGGLVGLNNGGTISNSYSKVNINEENTLVAGGIVGRSLAGNILNVYASGTIYIKYSDTTNVEIENGVSITTYYYKYIGGIVGTVANNFIYSEKFANVYNNDAINTSVVALLSNNNMLTINNAVSLVSYNYEKIEDYDKLKIGGIVGLVGSINGTIPIKEISTGNAFNNAFNSVIYKTAIPNIESTSDIAVNNITDLAVISDNANKEMAVPNGFSIGTNAYGANYELLQMLSDGKKSISDVYGTTTYEEWNRGNTTIRGVKSQIFLMHTLSNFEFENEDSKTPSLRDIEITQVDLSQIFEKLTSVTYECYILNDVKDLEILSMLINFGYVANGAKGLTFILENSINFNGASFAGIGTSTNAFRGTFDGNGNTISNIVLSNDSEYVGFINYASGAILKNIHFDNVTFNIASEQLANYVGTVAFASNTNISKVAVTNVSVINEKANIMAFGVMAGTIYGTTSGASVIQNSYTNINNININANSNISAFVYSTTAQGVNILNCYSNVNNVAMQNGVSGNVYGLIAISNTNSNMVNSWTKLYSGSISSTNLIPYNSGIRTVSVYTSVNNANDNFKSSSFYVTNSNWSGSNPWIVTANWNLDYLPSAYPVLSFVEKIVIAEPDTSTGFDGDRTHNITSATHLVNIAVQIRSGEIPNGGDGRIFNIMNDIDFANATIINGNPVQSLGSFEVPFRGIFNGDPENDGVCCTISNFTYIVTPDNESDYSLGFFGRLDSAVVKNVIFDGINITLKQTTESKGKAYLGSIAGVSNVSTINNLTVRDAVIELKQNENYAYIGGLLGYAESSKAVNCFLYTTLKATFVGDNISPLRAGGLIGYIKAQNMHVENNFVSLANATSLPSGSINHYGILVGYVTKTTSFTQIINNFYQNFSSLAKISGYGDVDKSNQTGTEDSIEEFI